MRTSLANSTTDQSNRRTGVVKHIYHPLKNKLYVPTSEGIHLIPFEKVLRVQSESNYCWIHLKNGTKHLVARTLKDVHFRLPQNLFIRIHNSHVVNAEEITVIETNGIVLSNEILIPVSKKFKTELKKLLEEIKY